MELRAPTSESTAESNRVQTVRSRSKNATLGLVSSGGDPQSPCPTRRDPTGDSHRGGWGRALRIQSFGVNRQIRKAVIGFLAAVVVVVILAGVMRRRALDSLKTELDLRLPRGSNGIILGAGPISLVSDGPYAVLLLHGGGDTPQSLHYVAEELSARGYTVLAPLLPGHGRGLREFGSVTADDWLRAARSALSSLQVSYAWVGVAGLSMGGALAAQLGAESPDIPAIVFLAPYLSMRLGETIVSRTSPLWKWLVPYARTASGGSIIDPVERARNLAYGVFMPSALYGLWITSRRGFASLPSVTAPALVVQSRQDNRITSRACEGSFSRLGSQEKRLVWINGAGHVLTVDYGRERVAELIGDWMDQHRFPTGHQPPGGG